MIPTNVQFLLVDDVKATEIQAALPGHQMTVLQDIEQADRALESQKFLATIVLLNSNYGPRSRWKIQGVDLAWSMRGCARNKEPLGKRNPILLTIPVVIYSVLDQKYLAAYSIAEFGQNIFEIPYACPLCSYICLTESKERIRKSLVEQIDRLARLEVDPELVGTDVSHSRLKLLTERFIHDFRHDVRNALQTGAGVSHARNSVNNLVQKIQVPVGGVGLQDAHLNTVVHAVHDGLQRLNSAGAHALPVERQHIAALAESVTRIADLFTLYALNVQSLREPKALQKTGVLIIEDDQTFAGQLREKLVHSLGFRQENVLLISKSEDYIPAVVVHQIKYNNEEEKGKKPPIEIAIVDLILRGDESAGIEILRNIRFEFPRIRIVVLSGRNDAQFDAHSHGADYYLTKPMEDEELCAVIREALNWKRVLLLETSQAHQDNLAMVKSFRRSNEGHRPGAEKYAEILQHVSDYFSSHWIRFESVVVDQKLDEARATSIEDGKYDLILLDALPKADQEWEQGKRIFVEIRRLSRNIPVIVLAPTGIGTLKNRFIFQELKHHFRIDYDRFWVKPLSLQKLREVVDIFREQGRIKYDVRYTLLLPKRYKREKLMVPLTFREVVPDASNLRGLRAAVRSKGIEISESARLKKLKGRDMWIVKGKNQFYCVTRVPHGWEVYEGRPINKRRQLQDEILMKGFLTRINEEFGGTTIWEGEGSWIEPPLVRDDQYIVHVLTRYAPGNREKLLKIIEDYAIETRQKVIFLQEEKVNTYELKFSH